MKKRYIIIIAFVLALILNTQIFLDGNRTVFVSRIDNSALIFIDRELYSIWLQERCYVIDFEVMENY